jgi:predicted NBD/HSP70 family sugar kinase
VNTLCVFYDIISVLTYKELNNKMDDLLDNTDESELNTNINKNEDISTLDTLKKLDLSSWQIVNAIRDIGTASLIDIVNMTNIPWATVHRSVNKILKPTGLIVSTKSEESRGGKTGRNPEMYTIKGEIGYFLGISVGDRFIKFRLLDFDFRSIPMDEEEWKINIEKDSKLSSIKIKIQKMLLKFTEEKSTFYSKLLGIGVSWPGEVDNLTQTIRTKVSQGLIYADVLSIKDIFTDEQWRDLESKEVKVLCEHNAKAAIISEKKIGNNTRMRPEKNIICLYLGTGISVGLLLNNQIYRGHSNHSGYIESNSLQKFTYRITKDGRDISKIDEHEAEELGKMLGTTVANMINLLNPELIIFTGGLSRCYNSFEPYLSDVVNSVCLTQNIRDRKYEKSTLENFSPAYGAAIMSYEKLEQDILNDA